MQIHCTMKRQTKWNKCKQKRLEYTKNIHILCWDLGGVKHMGVLTQDLHKHTTSFAMGTSIYRTALYSQHSDITGLSWATGNFRMHVLVGRFCASHSMLCFFFKPL